MLILGIESSCDETAAAVLKEGTRILSNVVASQIGVHKKYGGVVPELASRHHLENIVPVVNAALKEANIRKNDLDGVAVTQGPGLVGALLVGINYAKALCFSLKLPLVAVNHLEGHIYSVPLEIARNEYKKEASLPDWKMLLPAIVLVVSGGHTSLIWVRHIGIAGEGPSSHELVGRTRDDAAGEAFDKVAKLLGLGYPGGPIIDRLSRSGDPRAVEFPVARMSDGKLDFSFSGIKTAVVRYVRLNLEKEVAAVVEGRRQSGDCDKFPQAIHDVAASFQRTVANTLFERVKKAAEVYGPRSIMVSGGVACNSELRRCFMGGFQKLNLPVYFPSPALCTDNAAMIAAAGYPKLLAHRVAAATLDADANLSLGC